MLGRPDTRDRQRRRNESEYPETEDRGRTVTTNLEGDDFENRLCMILDFVAQDPTLERACRYAGYHPKYIWTLLKRSGEGNPKYLVRWPDRECEDRIQFGDAIALARRLHRVKLDGTLRSAVDIGIPEIQTFQGEVIWEKDGALLAQWGGDTLQAKQDAEGLGGETDYPYKHRIGPNGKIERVPLELYKPAPGSLRQHVARSLMPEVYNPPEVRSVSNEHSGAVLILNAGRAPYAKDFVQPDTPIKQDLHARLADLRSKGPQHRHAIDANGHKTIPKLGNGSTANDPPERQGYGPVPNIDADGHVVGARVKPMIGRNGKPAPGGFSALTGKPT